MLASNPWPSQHVIRLAAAGAVGSSKWVPKQPRSAARITFPLPDPSENAVDFQLVGRASGGCVGFQPCASPSNQPQRASQVAPFRMGDADAQLCQPLPQVALSVRAGFPSGFENLVG